MDTVDGIGLNLRSLDGLLSEARDIIAPAAADVNPLHQTTASSTTAAHAAPNDGAKQREALVRRVERNLSQAPKEVAAHSQKENHHGANKQTDKEIFNRLYSRGLMSIKSRTDNAYKDPRQPAGTTATKPAARPATTKVESRKETTSSADVRTTAKGDIWNRLYHRAGQAKAVQRVSFAEHTEGPPKARTLPPKSHSKSGNSGVFERLAEKPDPKPRRHMQEIQYQPPAALTAMQKPEPEPESEPANAQNKSREDRGSVAPEMLLTPNGTWSRTSSSQNMPKRHDDADGDEETRTPEKRAGTAEPTPSADAEENAEAVVKENHVSFKNETEVGKPLYHINDDEFNFSPDSELATSPLSGSTEEVQRPVISKLRLDKIRRR